MKEKFLQSKILLVFIVLSFCQGSVNAQMIAPPVINDFDIVDNKPVEIVQLDEGHYFIDFGKAYFGTVIIHAEQDQASSITVHMGENFQKSMRLIGIQEGQSDIKKL